MIRLLAKGFFRVASLLFLFGTVSLAQGQDPLTFDWEAFGKSLNRGGKLRADGAYARTVVANVANQLVRMKVSPNDTWGGRIVSSGKYGRQDIGTCGWINDAVQRALFGAGFRKDQIFGVVGVGSKAAELPMPEVVSEWVKDRLGVNRLTTWVNIDHVAPALVLGEEVVTFDLWSYARTTGAYSAMTGSKWNGMSLGKWIPSIQHYPGFEFSTYLKPPMVKAMDGQYLQEAIVDSQFKQRFGIKAKRNPKTVTSPAKNPTQGVTGPHWEFVEAKAVPIQEQVQRDPQRFFRTSAQGGVGALTVTSSWNDMALKVHRCAAALTWSVIGDYRKLKPGQQIGIKGDLAISGEVDRSFIGLNWHPPGYPAHVSHRSGINLFSVEVFGVNAKKSFEKLDIPVPGKDKFPDGKMVLRFLAGARGYGALEYQYRWVEK